MTVQVGDIVTTTARPGRWCVIRRELGGFVRIARNHFNVLRSHLVHPNSLTVIDRPIFEIGETVTLSDGREGTVVADDGTGPVRCTASTTVPLRGGGNLSGLAGGNVDADRAYLVLENRRLG